MNKTQKFILGADFHGSMTALDDFLDLAKVYNADKLILLGDIFGRDTDTMVEKLNKVADKLTIVKGNNDWYYELENAEFMTFNETYENINGRIAYVCHGHRLNDLNLAGYGAQIILQGHVHRPFIFKEQGVIRVCPGSLAVPRSGTAKAFAIIDENKISILTIDGKVIEETAY